MAHGRRAPRALYKVCERRNFGPGQGGRRGLVGAWFALGPRPCRPRAAHPATPLAEGGRAGQGRSPLRGRPRALPACFRRAAGRGPGRSPLRAARGEQGQGPRASSTLGCCRGAAGGAMRGGRAGVECDQHGVELPRSGGGGAMRGGLGASGRGSSSCGPARGPAGPAGPPRCFKLGGSRAGARDKQVQAHAQGEVQAGL